MSFVLLVQIIAVPSAYGIASDATATDSENEKSYEAMLNAIVGKNDMYPSEDGIWINEISQEYFLSIITNLSDQSYTVNQDGYLIQNVVNEDTFNTYDEKLKELIDGNKTIIVSISETYDAYNEALDESYSIMLEDDEFTVLFEKDSKCSITVLNYYHYAEHKDKFVYEDEDEFDEEYFYSDSELMNKFLEVFFSDEDTNESIENEQSSKNNAISAEEDKSDSVKDILEEDMPGSQTDTSVNIEDSVIAIDSETLSKIEKSAFANNDFEMKTNCIYVSEETKNTMSSVLETWYDNEYCLYDNEIKIDESLILNSTDNISLEDGTEYIFLGQDNDGNLLSAKLSDYINKDNGLLQLMNSNYSTLIVSYDQLKQNSIEINFDRYFCLLYYNNQLVIAINTEMFSKKFESIKDVFNNTIISFLSLYPVNAMQTFGVAVGFPIVYSGPGKNGYAAVGSLNAFETYETIYKELGFQYIEYTVDGTNTPKRGYIDQYGGGSGTIPSNYHSGMGAKVKSACTVYSGPSTTYATVGSVSSGESITLLSTASISGYYYFEYSSSSGTKRGYISSSNITTTSSTGMGVTLSDIDVYDDYVVNSGSLYQNEYFVITGVNDNYFKIEYNITTGRKTGYVHKSEVMSLNSYVTIPTIANSSALQATPKLSTYVYAGPSTSIYANIGSVDTSDTVGVLGKEGSYYYIQYSTSSGSKRGYVAMSALNSFSGSGSVKATGVESAAAYADAPSSSCTVYSCPNSNCATIGSIGAYEGITVFPSIKDNGYTFVEYSTASNTKRGFISTFLLKGYNEGVKAQANKDTAIYYTTAADLKLGSIYNEEYIIVLGKAGNYYYIEYNSPSGRKRGYTVKTALDLYSSSGISSIATSGETVKMNSAQTVYSGPSATYASVGSVSQNEYAVMIDKGTRGWYLIEYSTSSGKKQGYVPKSSATITAIPIYSEINYRTYAHADQHKSAYKSGLGKDLIYYTIGDENSDNVLFLNFAIHGHEDIYAGDGMALVEMAFKTISTLSNDYYKILSNDWFIVVVPTFNPDGILDGDNCDPRTNCKGIGRHNAVQMQQNSDGTWSKYTSGLGHIDMNRCFPYAVSANGTELFDDRYNNTNDSRNYTGPYAMMAQEAVALSELIKEYKSKSGKKYFIDIHGWYNQIIVDTSTINASPIGKALYENGFNFDSRDTSVAPCSYKTTYTLANGNGYVSKYALALGYTSCLFEFPADSDPDYLSNSTYGTYFINAIKDMVGI